MCIVAIAWQLFDELPLVVLSNRDEFYERPTTHAHQWQDLPIYAGRDDQSGGTWLGFHQYSDGLAKDSQNSHINNRSNQEFASQNGRWACVLNFRDGVQALPNQRSRGELVTQFLISELSPMTYARGLDLTAYAGFNLIVGDKEQAVIVNNRGYPPTSLHNGLHVFSNGQPDETWFKCERLRARVRQELLPLIVDNSDASYWQPHAFEILSDNTPAPAEQLPDTGIPASLEQSLSAICINTPKLPEYGTRTQSILLMQKTAQNELYLELYSQEYKGR